MYKKYGFYQKIEHFGGANIKGGNEMGILTFKGGSSGRKRIIQEQSGSEISAKGRYGISSFPAYRCSAAAIFSETWVARRTEDRRCCGFVSSPIHSSVSGTVKGIGTAPDSNRFYGHSIIIENDQQYEKCGIYSLTSGRSSKGGDFGEIKEGGEREWVPGFPTGKACTKGTGEDDHIQIVMVPTLSYQ